jgi:thiol:disulfide interchange protein DsbD
MHRSPRRPAFAVLFLLLLVPAIAWGAEPNEFDEAVKQGWLWVYLSSFGVGVLTSLTPCVYPMIPIVVGIFGAKEASSKLRAFGLATMYVLGMGVMFSALGLGAAATGKAMGDVLGLWYVVVPMVLLYVALAASMFGLFEMNLPPSLQAKLSTVGGKGVWGAFAMGLVGGLTAAPCTGPFLAGMLTYVATTRNLLVGGTLLFVYALGIGVLFWVIATFSLRLPKSGRWMEIVKIVGGIALLVVGLYYLRPVLPALSALTDPSYVFLAGAGGAVAIGLGFLVAHFKAGESRRAKLFKIAAIAICTAGAFSVINWMQTPKNPLPWRYDRVVACTEAKTTGRNVLVDFGANWCTPCKKIEADVFGNPIVYEHLTQNYVPLKVDLSNSTTPAARDGKAFWKNEGNTLPTVILADSDCKEQVRITEVPDVDDFLDDARKLTRTKAQ